MPRSTETNNAGERPKQLKDVAVTFKGHCMEESNKDRSKCEVICAYNISPIEYRNAITKMLSNGLTPQDIYGIGGGYSEQELGEPGPGISKYIVVGYTPRLSVDAPKYNIKVVGARKQNPVGVEIFGKVLKWDESAPPIPVVVKILQDRPEGVQLWALLEPEKGLRTPYMIAHERVYYRYEFRDNTTSVRGSAWNKIVFLKATINSPSASLVEKKKGVKRLRDGSEIIASTDFLSKEVDQYIAYQPGVEFPYLRLFADGKEELTLEEGQGVVDEMKKVWPVDPDDEGSLKPEFVVALKKGLIDMDKHLEYRLLKPFICQGCYAISQNSGLKFEQDSIGQARMQEDIRSTFKVLARTVPLPKSQKSEALISVKEPVDEVSDDVFIKSSEGDL